ncbi:MAG: AmmeMemoRadiSam system radical SAM enzyme [Nanoarchaeota archaeon]
MKQAKHYQSDFQGKRGIVQCRLCPRLCVLEDGQSGFCNVRQNMKGKLYSLVYGKAAAVNVDPIEKKPLFHFLPGSKVFSFGTIGCNLRCRHCQNWEITQVKPGECPEEDLSPEDAVSAAIASGSKSVAATYNEPTIFFEYMLDTFKLARKKSLRTVAVTNGFMCKEPIEELAPFVDAVNVDIKGFTQDFYGKVTSARLQPVLDAIALWKKKGVWLELTNLVIPGHNDDPKEVETMCKWILDNLGPDVPLHFTAFFPMNKMLDVPPTKPETLFSFRELAKKQGLHHAYVGNVRSGEGEHTICPSCGKAVIRRKGYVILENALKQGKCPGCGIKVAGLWS